MSKSELNDRAVDNNQYSKIRSHLRGICAHITVCFLLAILPTGCSILLALLLPNSPATMTVFNTLNCLSQAFNPVGGITFILSLVPLGISHTQAKIPFPDPLKLYIQVYTQSSQTDSLQDMQKKLRSIKDYVTLKIYFAFPADLYEAFFGKTYQQLLSEMNPLAGTLSIADVGCHELMIDLGIARLAGWGSQKDLAHECETFSLRITFIYETMMKFVIPLAKWLLVVSLITSVTDFSNVDNLVTSIPLHRIFSLWLTIVFFYVGRSLTDIYGKEKYFFNITEKKVSVKEFYEVKNRQMDLHLANLVNYLVFY